MKCVKLAKSSLDDPPEKGERQLRSINLGENEIIKYRTILLIKKRHHADWKFKGSPNVREEFVLVAGQLYLNVIDLNHHKQH